MQKSLVSQLPEHELTAMHLSAPAFPHLNTAMVKILPPQERLAAYQDFIASLRYNHVPGYHYNVRKRRPFHQLMATARDVMAKGLPIKCIEAAMLAMYLTCSCKAWHRYAVGFKSKVTGQCGAYRHIVLIVHDAEADLWGALGISRRANLMYKPLQYVSLSSLITDFIQSYAAWRHRVVKVCCAESCASACLWQVQGQHSGRTAWLVALL